MLRVVAVLCALTALARADDAPRLPDKPPPPTTTNVVTKPPRLVQAQAPDYPPAALTAGKQAKVKVKIHIDDTGIVSSVDVVDKVGDGFDEAAVAALSAPSVHPSTVAREHVLRVSYDGEDLHEVAARTRMSPAEVVRLHSEGTYEVAMMGFTPGFAYLSGIDGRLVVARRAMPRTSVPAGSVAVAGPYTGVYPRESPGGWNIIGTVVDCAMFDAELGPRLALGDRVRFEPVT